MTVLANLRNMIGGRLSNIDVTSMSRTPTALVENIRSLRLNFLFSVNAMCSYLE